MSRRVAHVNVVLSPDKTITLAVQDVKDLTEQVAKRDDIHYDPSRLIFRYKVASANIQLKSL